MKAYVFHYLFYLSSRTKSNTAHDFAHKVQWWILEWKSKSCFYSSSSICQYLSVFFSMNIHKNEISIVDLSHCSLSRPIKKPQIHIHLGDVRWWIHGNKDEDEEPRCVQLTNQHKGAIRFIRKVNSYLFHFPTPKLYFILSYLFFRFSLDFFSETRDESIYLINFYRNI